jgi:5,10-methenyltetrahydromethanopterin hydrogenase
MVPTDLIVNTSVQHAITRLVKDLMEIVQVDVLKTTIYHMGIAKTPDKKHNVYITKQYGKTEDNIQSSKKGIGKDTWCFERASSISSYLQIRI